LAIYINREGAKAPLGELEMISRYGSLVEGLYYRNENTGYVDRGDKWLAYKGSPGFDDKFYELRLNKIVWRRGI